MAKSKDPPIICGVFAALATPRRANSTEVDTAAFFDYQDGVMRGGVDGLVLFGSTGEFVHFDISDRAHVISLTSKRARVPVLVNVSHSSIEGTLSLAESALSAEVAGLLVMPPYFYRYTDAQILAFYERFAEVAARRTNLFLYNLPFFTNPLSYSVIEQLLVSGLYAGIKDSSGDRDLMNQLKHLHVAKPFTWFVGSESLYLEARSYGADGIISGVAGAVPELIVALERATSAPAMQHADRLNRLLNEFVDWVDKFPATIAIKQAAVVRGWKLDHCAFRFDETTNAEMKAFRSWFEKWLPRTLAECPEPVAARA
ncbi:MAG: dihydrodipicolinate synthase family protein [Acidobacteriaceae bacterium]|nr:dihydrodipicolinate synthase family protein [Acidobacteriaceae bacterium]